MTEAASFSETLVLATRRHIPKYRKLDNAIKNSSLTNLPPLFYGIPKFITVFRAAHHLSFPLAKKKNAFHTMLYIY